MERFKPGSIVQVIAQPPFLKTADPMPMLRSGTLVQLHEVGRVERVEPAGYYAVRFANGVFLIDQSYLQLQP